MRGPQFAVAAAARAGRRPDHPNNLFDALSIFLPLKNDGAAPDGQVLPRENLQPLLRVIVPGKKMRQYVEA